MSQENNLTMAGRLIARFSAKIKAHRAPDNTEPIQRNDAHPTLIKDKSPIPQYGFKKRLGTVNFFNEESSYGFVRDTATKESFFVYRSGLLERVAAKDIVSFEIEKTPGGSIAINVQKRAVKK